MQHAFPLLVAMKPCSMQTTITLHAEGFEVKLDFSRGQCQLIHAVCICLGIFLKGESCTLAMLPLHQAVSPSLLRPVMTKGTHTQQLLSCTYTPALNTRT